MQVSVEHRPPIPNGGIFFSDKVHKIPLTFFLPSSPICVKCQLFFGFVGAINLLCFWPIGVILHYADIEPFSLPHTHKLWLSVLINAMCTFVSDYMYVSIFPLCARFDMRCSETHIHDSFSSFPSLPPPIHYRRYMLAMLKTSPLVVTLVE
jgi:hypothetical protein